MVEVGLLEQINDTTEEIDEINNKLCEKSLNPKSRMKFQKTIKQLTMLRKNSFTVFQCLQH